MQPYVQKLNKLRLDLVRSGQRRPKAILTKGGQGGPQANLSKIVYTSALRSGQLHGLGQDASVAAPAAPESFTARLQRGDLIPDDLGGISTKTILAAVLVFCLLRR